MRETVEDLAISAVTSFATGVAGEENYKAKTAIATAEIFFILATRGQGAAAATFAERAFELITAELHHNEIIDDRTKAVLDIAVEIAIQGHYKAPFVRLLVEQAARHSRHIDTENQMAFFALKYGAETALHLASGDSDLTSVAKNAATECIETASKTLGKYAANAAGAAFSSFVDMLENLSEYTPSSKRSARSIC